MQNRHTGSASTVVALLVLGEGSKRTRKKRTGFFFLENRVIAEERREGCVAGRRESIVCSLGRLSTSAVRERMKKH